MDLLSCPVFFGSQHLVINPSIWQHLFHTSTQETFHVPNSCDFSSPPGNDTFLFPFPFAQMLSSNLVTWAGILIRKSGKQSFRNSLKYLSTKWEWHAWGEREQWKGIIKISESLLPLAVWFQSTVDFDKKEKSAWSLETVGAAQTKCERNLVPSWLQVPSTKIVFKKKSILVFTGSSAINMKSKIHFCFFLFC